MNVSFATDDLLSTCNDDKRAKRAFGADGAKKLRVRLDDLTAAGTLDAMRHLPGHCHELKGNLAGHLALDLDGGRRLVFRQAHNPLPLKDDSGLDWKRVTAIVVTEIGDYHG